jgi:hypothetical protein
MIKEIKLRELCERPDPRGGIAGFRAVEDILAILDGKPPPITEEEAGALVKAICETQWGAVQCKTHAELDGYFDAGTLRRIADVLDRIK